MIERKEVNIMLPDGDIKKITILISCEYPWSIEANFPNGVCRHYNSSDIFSAFQDMRTEFEKKEIRFLCAGARPDVVTSGMSRSMSGGRKAYIIKKGKPANLSDMVDIFDYAKPSVIGTVAQQEEFFKSWVNSFRNGV
ncbi:hypothetical protein [Komagataeibacter diospyri]|uniref:hypothetical protein n=1 Tax=Komagataeibacter diospyri TaxID=1932662 RepID=UPI0037566EE2